ncbi:hypothetical protein KIPB_005168 [Kipferlia bialata]|uniref:Uncharacterized protein n=1 Tax=Kipferlia bialata TaxID=797122 RepID=A0A9K3CW91_9EUKA|nr:hypothetical protein KIPB_005168 [Kipferlia bialata]|eukprot:g5168.t1
MHLCRSQLEGSQVTTGGVTAVTAAPSLHTYTPGHVDRAPIRFETIGSLFGTAWRLCQVNFGTTLLQTLISFGLLALGGYVPLMFGFIFLLVGAWPITLLLFAVGLIGALLYAPYVLSAYTPAVVTLRLGTTCKHPLFKEQTKTARKGRYWPMVLCLLISVVVTSLVMAVVGSIGSVPALITSIMAGTVIAHLPLAMLFSDTHKVTGSLKAMFTAPLRRHTLLHTFMWLLFTLAISVLAGWLNILGIALWIVAYPYFAALTTLIHIEGNAIAVIDVRTIGARPVSVTTTTTVQGV